RRQADQPQRRAGELRARAVPGRGLPDRGPQRPELGHDGPGPVEPGPGMPDPVGRVAGGSRRSRAMRALLNRLLTGQLAIAGRLRSRPANPRKDLKNTVQNAQSRLSEALRGHSVPEVDCAGDAKSLELPSRRWARERLLHWRN